jgi:hypothetical protein
VKRLTGSLQPLGVHSEDYTTCDRALKVCGVWSGEQVLDQHLINPEKNQKWKRKFAENKATFLDALKGLEAARKYVCQFDTKNSITLMYNRVENKLCRLKSQEEKKQKTDWLKK